MWCGKCIGWRNLISLYFWPRTGRVRAVRWLAFYRWLSQQAHTHTHTHTTQTHAHIRHPVEYHQWDAVIRQYQLTQISEQINQWFSKHELFGWKQIWNFDTSPYCVRYGKPVRLSTKAKRWNKIKNSILKQSESAQNLEFPRIRFTNRGSPPPQKLQNCTEEQTAAV